MQHSNNSSELNNNIIEYFRKLGIATLNSPFDNNAVDLL